LAEALASPRETPILSTTTSSLRVSALERIRGFTVRLLLRLRDNPERCCEVAAAMEKPRAYVHRYLKNMQIYGLTLKSASFWHLTDLGRFFADYFLKHVKELEKSRKIDERKKKEERKIDETTLKVEPKLQRQTFLSLWLQKSTLPAKEQEVVEMLTAHYQGTGSKFRYFKTVYDLAEQLQISPEQVKQVMMNLTQSRVAYCWKDPKFDAWKVGLYKAFVRTIINQEP